MKGRQQTQQLVKQVLSREFQLYCARPTQSSLPPALWELSRGRRCSRASGTTPAHRLSCRLILWVAEGVVDTLGGGPERAWGAFGCCLCIVGQLDTLHRTICKLSHGSLAFTNAPSSSRTKFHRPSCPVFYYIRCYRPSHSQLRTSTAQTMSHLLTTSHRLFSFGPPYHELPVSGVGFSK